MTDSIVKVFHGRITHLRYDETTNSVVAAVSTGLPPRSYSDSGEPLAIDVAYTRPEGDRLRLFDKVDIEVKWLGGQAT